jgi:hypothetical protein
VPPYRYIREDFSLRNLDDLNVQLQYWFRTVANPRVHDTTQSVVKEAFAKTYPGRVATRLVPRRAQVGTACLP